MGNCQRLGHEREEDKEGRGIERPLKDSLLPVRNIKNENARPAVDVLSARPRLVDRPHEANCRRHLNGCSLFAATRTLRGRKSRQASERASKQAKICEWELLVSWTA